MLNPSRFLFPKVLCPSLNFNNLIIILCSVGLAVKVHGTIIQMFIITTSLVNGAFWVGAMPPNSHFPKLDPLIYVNGSTMVGD